MVLTFIDARSDPVRDVGTITLEEDGSLTARGPEWVHVIATERAGKMDFFADPEDGEMFLLALEMQYSGSALRSRLEPPSTLEIPSMEEMARDPRDPLRYVPPAR